MGRHLWKQGLRKCRVCKKVKRLSSRYFPVLAAHRAYQYHGFGYICKPCIPRYLSKFTRYRFSKLRLRLLKRRGFRCQECHVHCKDPSFFDLDHVKRPPRKGRWGKTPHKLTLKAKNLRILCPNCHRKKTLKETKEPH